MNPATITVQMIAPDVRWVGDVPSSIQRYLESVIRGRCIGIRSVDFNQSPGGQLELHVTAVFDLGPGERQKVLRSKTA